MLIFYIPRAVKQEGKTMYNTKKSKAVKHVKKDLPPARTADEWLAREGLTIWPEPMPSEGELDLSSMEQRLETKDLLLADLKKHTSFDINILDDFLERVNGLEDLMNGYADHFLEIKKEKDDDHTILNPTVDDSIDEMSERMSAAVLRQKKMSHSIIKARKRSVESTPFPGFRSNELTPLPGSLEAPQLLNKVTNIQCFRGSFKKLWKSYFLSEATVAIFQDSFWWWFLDRFQPNPESQASLFNRLSDSFVGLFLSITMKGKDLFFQKFAVCLAQAVYAAFCESFPMSFKLFDDDFRSDLLNTLSEWITGVRPPLDSWRQWNLDLLEPDQMKSLQEDRTQHLKSTLSFNQDTFLDLNTSIQTLERKVTFHRAHTKVQMSDKESHQIGPGPQFQRVAFNLHGNSPLISHFLAANKIQVEEPAALQKLVTRTEVEKYPPSLPTYQDIIRKRRKEARLAAKNYMESMGIPTYKEKQRTFSPKPIDASDSDSTENIEHSILQVFHTIDGANEKNLTMDTNDEADGIATNLLH